jgi:hypothetical protein
MPAAGVCAMLFGSMDARPMQFTNPPRPLPASLYEEATSRYVENVSSRAIAIYRVGAFSYPGLSDIDLLVVPDGARFDNGLWFAVRNQLPAALRAPFRSDPGIVPRDLVDVLRFTTHGKRDLLFGEDVAAGVVCDESSEQRWSMFFERLCQFDRVARATRASAGADLAKLVSKTKSLAYSLIDLDVLVDKHLSAAFAAEVDALRAGFFDLDLEEAGPRTWQLFERGLFLVEDTLAEQLPLSPGQSPVEFGRAFLHGSEGIPGLSDARLAERRDAVSRAQHATRAMGFRKGDLFMRTPYAQRIAELNRGQRSALPLRALAAAAYRVRSAMMATGTQAAAQK